MLSLGSSKMGVILLNGLFVYDISWVSFTSVMVSVANSFNAPSYSQFQILHNHYLAWAWWYYDHCCTTCSFIPFTHFCSFFKYKHFASSNILCGLLGTKPLMLKCKATILNMAETFHPSKERAYFVSSLHFSSILSFDLQQSKGFHFYILQKLPWNKIPNCQVLLFPNEPYCWDCIRN